MALTKQNMDDFDPWQKNVAKLLTTMSGIDGRDVTPLMVASWAELLIGERRLTAEDCDEAIRQHYLSENRRMWPADLIKGCRAIRAKRMKEQERKQLVAPNPDAVPMPEELRKRIGSLADKKTLD